MTSKKYLIGLSILKVVAAIIMIQTLFFKFSAAPESVYIFSKIGMEPWGRIGVGILELIASLLILYPRYTAWGALLGLGVMGGALWFHFTVLGIEVQGDFGQLFIYASVVFLCCLVLLIVYRRQILRLFHRREIRLV